MLPALAVAAAVTTVAGCPVFPASSPWNEDVSKLPVAARSAQYVKAIGVGRGLHPDFASHTYGIPFEVVGRTQRKLPVKFTDYADESDPGPYPVPRSAPVERGGDRHVIVVQRGTCELYELFGAQRTKQGWSAA